jgi:TolB protein
VSKRLNRREFIRVSSAVAGSAFLGVKVLDARQDQIGGIGLSRDGGMKAVRLALPEFRPTTPSERGDKLAKIFNDTLRADIDFSGNIELASPSFYPKGTFARPGDIRVEDWTAPGINAQYLGYGDLAITATGLTATGRLRDLGAPQDSFGSLFPGTGEEAAARLVAHNFADRILRELGFGRGIFHTQIAFVSDRSGSKEIYVMDYDGTNQHPITANGSISIAPSWSPVDDRIAYTVWRPGPQIAIASAVGQRHSFAQVTGITNNIPSWSPDGKSVVYASRRDGNSEIYLTDADGRNPRRLTTSPAIDTSPVFNPATGRTIAFTSDRTGTQQIHTMNADGTDVQRITEEGGDAENPAYSPDGRLLAFAWNKPRSGGYDIYIYDTATRKFSQLTSNAGNNENPTWAPDGKHIAFESNRSGRTQIYSMIVSPGKQPIQLTRNGSNEGPTWSGFATP